MMGGAMLYDIAKSRLKYTGSEAAEKSSLRLAVKGITATLSNPFWFIWWATTGLAFIAKSFKFGVMGPVVFYFGHILSDFVWYGAVSIILWQGKSLLIGRRLNILICCCALFLVYLGITFIIGGLSI